MTNLTTATNNQITNNTSGSFSIQWRGFIQTPLGKAGSWNFRTGGYTSLWIGSSTSNPTVNNSIFNNSTSSQNGFFTMVENTTYPILIQYYNPRSTNATLSLSIIPPNSTRELSFNNNGFNLISMTNNWTGFGNTIFSLQGNGIVYGNSKYVATGQGVNSIAVSSDGTTWIGLGTTIFSLSGNGVCHNSSLGLFVAVGQGRNVIAYSPNGTQWTGVATTMFSAGLGIQWSSPFFIATGYGTTNTIAFSSNGLAWTGLGTTIMNDMCLGSSSLTNNNSIIYQYSQQHVMEYFI
jgi:hypothetical protein